MYFLPSFSCGLSGYKTNSIAAHSRVLNTVGRHRHRLWELIGLDKGWFWKCSSRLSWSLLLHCLTTPVLLVESSRNGALHKEKITLGFVKVYSTAKTLNYLHQKTDQQFLREDLPWHEKLNFKTCPSWRLNSASVNQKTSHSNSPHTVHAMKESRWFSPSL